MTLTDPIAFSGAPGSPYTRKMLAILRYRRIPYRFLLAGLEGPAGLPEPKVRLLPTFYLPGPDGTMEAVTDSTPLLRRLDREHAARRTTPEDAALAFLDALIEDYADEWLTKAMFHYRWVYAPDIEKAGLILPLWRDRQVDAATLAARAASVRERQIGRLGVVGSSPQTASLIEASYRRALDRLEAHIQVSPFMLGRRPGACDFAIYGQLTQLTHFDPTPMAIAVRDAPRVFAWVDAVDDLSGLEPSDADWIKVGSAGQTLRDLLAEIGRVYTPVMLANARAVAAGADAVEAEIDGQAWRQAPFPYQAKCLQTLRAGWAGLPPAATADLGPLLEAAGLDRLFA